MAKREIRPIRVEGQVAYVPLTKGYEAIIDAADVPLVDGFNWCADVHHYADGSVKVVYAVRNSPRDENGKQRAIMMHRVLLDAPHGMQVDHASSDGLDNRRSNIRLASRAENMWNRRNAGNNGSGFKGVHWSKAAKAWVARIAANGKRRTIGKYNCATAAAIAYARASEEMHGEFGRVA